MSRTAMSKPPPTRRRTTSRSIHADAPRQAWLPAGLAGPRDGVARDGKRSSGPARELLRRGHPVRALGIKVLLGPPPRRTIGMVASPARGWPGWTGPGWTGPGWAGRRRPPPRRVGGGRPSPSGSPAAMRAAPNPPVGRAPGRRWPARASGGAQARGRKHGPGRRGPRAQGPSGHRRRDLGMRARWSPPPAARATACAVGRRC